MFGWVSICGIIWGLALHQIPPTEVEQVEAYEAVVEDQPQVVRLEVIYNWDKDRIKDEIRQLFPESPELAVAIAQCESNFKMVQSNHILHYGREESFGIFQIHARAWHEKAVTLGYENYQTDIRDNLNMARWIYEQHGWRPWTCLKYV